MRIVCLLFVLLAYFGRAAQGDKCASCGQPLGFKVFLIYDKVAEVKQPICPACSNLPNWCFACNLPVGGKHYRVGDGRVLCERDAKAAVLSEEEARQVCEQTKEELTGLLNKYMTWPTNLAVRIVDRVEMEILFKTPGYENTCGSVYGFYKKKGTNDVDRYAHTVNVLSAQTKAGLMATAAHEFTHAWVDENVPESRKMEPDAEEGFCELVAYKLMEQQNFDYQRRWIKTNTYTRGYIDLLLQADSQFGLYTVVQWVKAGEDRGLTEDSVDRIRLVKTLKAAPTGQLLVLTQSVPTPVPDTLVLKGISGSAKRRLAIINDATLEKNEESKVRVGTSNVVVRCLEITDKSVVITINGAAEKKELILESR